METCVACHTLAVEAVWHESAAYHEACLPDTLTAPLEARGVPGYFGQNMPGIGRQRHTGGTRPSHYDDVGLGGTRGGRNR